MLREMLSFDSAPKNADYCSPKQAKRENHESSIHARNTYRFTRTCRRCHLATPFEHLSRQTYPQTPQPSGEAIFPSLVDTDLKILSATRGFDGNQLTSREYSTMNRSAECLVDAGCFREFSAPTTRENGKAPHIRGLFDTLNIWYERSRQRRDLLKLASDITLLDDLGLSIYDIRREARKHFWNE